MKLVMTLLVRDEIDIVGENIEFHLNRGVDAIVAIDNASADGTRDVLEVFAKQGVLDLLVEPGRDFSQSQWVTRAALHARDRMGADWVLNNDADEFWMAPSGSLKDHIRDVQVDTLRCRRNNMLLAAEDLPESGDIDGFVYRIAQPIPRPAVANLRDALLPCPYFYLDLPGKVMARTRGLTRICQGNHNVEFAGHVPRTQTSPIEIFHFPIRSRAQFERKIIRGGQAYEANTKLPAEMGWHWRRWYLKYCRAGLDAVLADALPGHDALGVDLRNGIVIEDTRFRDMRFN